VLAIFMAPVSAGIKINDKQQLAVGVEVSEARAQEAQGFCTITHTIGIFGTDREDYVTKSQCEVTPLPYGVSKTVFTPYSSSNPAPTTPTDKSKTVLPIETENNYSLSCGIGFGLASGNLGGCLASILYVIWQGSALVAELGGKFLDFFVYYATNSSSYGNDFVKLAWGAVRDIANIFFIIALLYVAIKTILGLNVTDNKKLISAVIIVALVINFSLFTTELVIDGSNILAKVFYNNITSKTQNADGTVQDSLAGSGGEKSISVGLVRGYNPQLIIGKTAYNANGGVSMFIFTTIVLLAITLYTAYIFFSVALLFVARVVSLWISMIFSPIAFVSYTVPFDIPGFGHKKWWSGLIENALLAPLFIFFLYIIILFLDFGKNLTYTDSTDPLQKIMSVVIPFAIIFILLREAKKLAVEYSGELGAGITKAGAVIGGLALGGTALGVAAIGRGTVGAFMKGASTGDTAANRMQGADARIALHQATLNNPNSTIVERTHASREIRREQKDKLKGNIQQAIGLQAAQTWVGKRLNQDQHNIEHAAHARHDLDTAAGVVAPGKKWDELNGEQRRLARTNMERDRERRARGWGNRTWANLSPDEQRAIDADVNPRVASGTTHADQTIIQEARVKQGVVSNIAQSTVTGSYDARNLSKVIAKEQSTGFSKIAAGLTGALAMGLRSGLKSTLNVNYGEGQGGFIKDLGHTITEALKGAKINVDLSHVGEEKKEEHKGGGGHH